MPSWTLARVQCRPPALKARGQIRRAGPSAPASARPAKLPLTRPGGRASPAAAISSGRDAVQFAGETERGAAAQVERQALDPDLVVLRRVGRMQLALFDGDAAVRQPFAAEPARADSKIEPRALRPARLEDRCGSAACRIPAPRHGAAAPVRGSAAGSRRVRCRRSPFPPRGRGGRRNSDNRRAARACWRRSAPPARRRRGCPCRCARSRCRPGSARQVRPPRWSSSVTVAPRIADPPQQAQRRVRGPAAPPIVRAIAARDRPPLVRRSRSWPITPRRGPAPDAAPVAR